MKGDRKDTQYLAVIFTNLTIPYDPYDLLLNVSYLIPFLFSIFKH